MELGETPEAGALRELLEETGLKGRINTLLGVTSTYSPLYQTVLMVGFFVDNYTGTLISGDDASDARFFNPDALPEIAFTTHINFIKQYYSTHRS